MHKARILLLSAIMLVTGCGGSVDDTHRVERAKEFLDQGKLQAAAIELKNAVQQNPNNLEARHLLGVAHLRAGDDEGAEKELRRAMDLGIAPESVLPQLALALFRQGKYDDLVDLNLAGLRNGQEKAEVLALQARAMIRQGKAEEARGLTTEALRLAPDSRWTNLAEADRLIARERKDDARKILAALLARYPDFAPGWSLLGDLERGDQRMAQAEEAYSKAIEHGGAPLKDRLLRALVRIQLGKYDSAREDLRALSGVLSKHPTLWYAKGLILLHDGKLRDALDAFEQSIKWDSRQLMPVYYLALINLQLGNLVQAEDYGEKALALAPLAVEVRKALTLVKLRKKAFEEAEQLIRPVAQQRVGDRLAKELLADALRGEKRFDAALPLYRELAEQYPSAKSETRLGITLIAAGQTTEGLAHLKAAVQKDPGFAPAWIALVRTLSNEGQHETALRYLNTYRENAPNDPTAWNLTGVVRLASGDEEGARQAYQKAAQIAPGDPPANHALAALAVKQHNYVEARQRYGKVLKHHQGYLPTILLLAQLEALEGEPEKMVKRLEEAIAEHPESISPRLMLARHYLAIGEPEKVQTALVGLSEGQKEEPDVLYVTAQSALALRQYDEAEYSLKKLLKMAPATPGLHYLMANVKAGLGDAAALKAELQKTVELAPRHLPARVALARLALAEGKVHEAREQLAGLKEIAPEHPEVLYLEALLVRGNDPGKAESLMQQVFAEAPNTRTMISLARQKIVAGDLDGAIALQKQWLEEHPNDRDTLLELAGTYSKTGDWNQAEALYHELLKRDKSDLVALNDLAWLLRDRDPSQAMRYAQRAASIAPGRSQILDTLAMVQLANGQPSAAERSIERALTRSPNDPEMRYHAAVIAEAAGKTDKALRILDKLLVEEKRNFPQRQAAEALKQKLSKH